MPSPYTYVKAVSLQTACEMATRQTGVIYGISL